MRAGLAIFLPGVLLSSCTPDPDATVLFSASVVNEQGATLGNSVAHLLRSDGVSCPGGFSAGRADAGFSLFRDTRSDDAGNVLYQLTVADVSSRFRARGSEGSVCFQISSPSDSQGGSGLLQFTDQSENDRELAGLVKWQQVPTVETSDAGLVLSPLPPPPLPGYPPAGGFVNSFRGVQTRGFSGRYDAWLIQADDGVAWEQVVDGGALIIPELVEDFHGTSLVQRAVAQGRTDPLQGPFDTEAFTSPSAIAASGVVPQSRGAGCSWSGADASILCPLTDGKLSAVDLTGGSPMGPSQIVVQLASPLVPRLILVRGLFVSQGLGSTLVVLEGSTDQIHWTSLATASVDAPPSGSADPAADGLYVQLTPQASSAISFVRLSAQSPGLNMPAGSKGPPGPPIPLTLPISGLAEISIF